MYDVNHHISGSTPDGKGIPPTAKIVPGLGTRGQQQPVGGWGGLITAVGGRCGGGAVVWFGGPAIFCRELVARTQQSSNIHKYILNQPIRHMAKLINQIQIKSFMQHFYNSPIFTYSTKYLRTILTKLQLRTYRNHHCLQDNVLRY